VEGGEGNEVVFAERVDMENGVANLLHGQISELLDVTFAEGKYLDVDRIRKRSFLRVISLQPNTIFSVPNAIASYRRVVAIGKNEHVSQKLNTGTAYLTCSLTS